MDRRSLGGLIGAAIATLGVAVAVSARFPENIASQITCAPPRVDISGRSDISDVLCNDAELFADYSWRAFIALTWRGDPVNRGVQLANSTIGDARAPRVFETFKAAWETLRGAQDPGEWNEYIASPPCDGVTLQRGDLVLSADDKFDDVHQQVATSASTGTLTAQNGTYVRYAIGYNRTAYEAIRRNRWYLGNGLEHNLDGSAPSLPNGSIAVKSAWIEVNARFKNPSRYYRRTAWVRRVTGSSNACDSKQVALIGLHVAQKTARSPQWIWTSFEHADNVPPRHGEPARTGPFALHDDTTPAFEMPERNPSQGLQIAPNPQPQNIIGVLPFSEATTKANQVYRNALREKAIWANYQLVMTQWPRNLGRSSDDGSTPNSIPGQGLAASLTAYANPAFESYFQTPISNSCMSCHNNVRDVSDFLWGPAALATQPTQESTSSTKRKRAIDALIARLGIRK